jgi:hypothetical protein
MNYSIKLLLVLFTVLPYISSKQNFLEFGSDHKLKLAFGSCNKFYQSDNSSIFYQIAKNKPDLWAWIGKHLSS